MHVHFLIYLLKILLSLQAGDCCYNFFLARDC